MFSHQASHPRHSSIHRHTCSIHKPMLTLRLRLKRRLRRGIVRQSPTLNQQCTLSQLQFTLRRLPPPQPQPQLLNTSSTSFTLQRALACTQANNTNMLWQLLVLHPQQE
jgi:hypothetical protein